MCNLWHEALVMQGNNRIEIAEPEKASMFTINYSLRHNKAVLTESVAWKQPEWLHASACRC